MKASSPVSPVPTRIPQKAKSVDGSTPGATIPGANAIRSNRDKVVQQLIATLATISIKFPRICESDDVGTRDASTPDGASKEPPGNSSTFRCENYPEQLVGRLNEQRKNDSKLCDVVLHVGSQKTTAHRIILASGSKYFSELFEGGPAASLADNLVIPNVKEDAFMSIVDFLYTGELPINTENVQNLLTAASVLQVKQAEQGCVEFLKMRLHMMNCLSMLRLAQLIQNEELTRACMEFVRKNFDKILDQREELQRLDDNVFEQLISTDDLQVPEDDRLKAILIWQNNHISTRQDVASKLCRHIRIPKLSKSYLQSLCQAEDQWTSATWLNRFLMQALLRQLLPDGPEEVKTPVFKEVIVVTGGGLAKNTVEYFDLETQKWTASPSEPRSPGASEGKPLVIPNLPRARHGCAAVVLDDRLYVLGGHTDAATSSVLIFDAEAVAWSAGPDMLSPRRWLGAAVLDGKIYAIGGNDGKNRLDSGEVLDSGAEKWRAIAPMSYSRSSVGLAAWHNCIIAAGGFTDDDVRLPTVESYNPETNVWTRIANMTSPRCALGLCVLGDRLYAAGGWSSGGAVCNSAEFFSPETNSWTKVASMTMKRGGLGLVEYNGILYAVGGWDGVQRSSSIEQYDPAADKWTPIPSQMKTSRYNAGVAVVRLKLPE